MQFAKYNEDLQVPVFTETGTFPKARVHRAEWKKVRGGGCSARY